MRAFSAYSGAMAITRLTVALHQATGEDIDDCVNVWHFEHTATLDATSALKLGNGVKGFYQAFQGFIGTSVIRSADSGKMTFTQVTPGSPGSEDDTVTAMLFEQNINFNTSPAGGTVNLPSEVALAVSFAGNLVGLAEEEGLTRPRSRRRGRVFLGPWSSAAAVNDGDWNHAVTNPSLETIIKDAYAALILAINAEAPKFMHVIYSPTNGTTADVQSMWIDYDWDTIRSRGINTRAATVRVPVTQTSLP